MLRLILTALVLLPLTARAETCPAPPNHGDSLDALYQEVQAAPSEAAAQRVVNRMWELWADAPDARAQEILDRGLRRRASFDYLGAVQDFDRLIAYCPDYAEGYNQRGFISFIRRDYPAALVDLDRVIALSPRHMGALTGRALTLMALGRTEAARADLLRALALNPWLPERRFLDQLPPLDDETDL
ncbi:tetratricopeptide repeat protein [Marinovum sp.]|uniref:tetratricopeptide repeat protein n=1 Tax=Marinovum sp. TaxID=2024839 RepID=UPI003A93FEE4